MNSKMYECSVCNESRADDLMYNPECKHGFCIHCWKSHIEATGHKELPKCMSLGCDRGLLLVEVLEISRKHGSDKLFERFNDLAANAYVSTAIEMVVCKSCSSVGETRKDVTSVVCWKCNIHICPHCGDIPHPGSNCLDFERNKKSDASVSETRETDKTGLTKECPSCSIKIGKDGGCDKVSCTQCGYSFCWKCGCTYSVHHECGSSIDARVKNNGIPRFITEHLYKDTDYMLSRITALISVFFRSKFDRVDIRSLVSRDNLVRLSKIIYPDFIAQYYPPESHDVTPILQDLLQLSSNEPTRESCDRTWKAIRLTLNATIFMLSYHSPKVSWFRRCLPEGDAIWNSVREVTSDPKNLYTIAFSIGVWKGLMRETLEKHWIAETTAFVTELWNKRRLREQQRLDGLVQIQNKTPAFVPVPVTQAEAPTAMFASTGSNRKKRQRPENGGVTPSIVTSLPPIAPLFNTLSQIRLPSLPAVMESTPSRSEKKQKMASPNWQAILDLEKFAERIDNITDFDIRPSDLPNTPCDVFMRMKGGEGNLLLTERNLQEIIKIVASQAVAKYQNLQSQNTLLHVKRLTHGSSPSIQMK